MSIIFILGACKGFGGVFSDEKPAAFKPGSVVNLPTATGGFQPATVIDMNGDGVADGLDIFGNGISALLYISIGANRTIGIDVNGDGIVDYYLRSDLSGNASLSTAATGGSNVTITSDAAGQPTGFDTNGDGAADNTILTNIRNDVTAPTISPSIAGDTFAAAQSITLTCSDNVACNAVAYTTDGSTPSFSGGGSTIVPGNKATVTISSTTTVRFVSRDAYGNLSGVGSQTYTISGGGGANCVLNTSTLDNCTLQ